MNSQILVAYASKHGNTAEIAAKIAEVLRQNGCVVELMKAEEVKDVSAFDAVVLGSGVYAGTWLKEAIHLLETQEKQLALRPVWLFSSGPTGEGDPSTLMKGWRFPSAQQPIADRIKPRDIAFFHGVLDLNELNFAEKLIIKGIKAPIGDFRDWNMIKNWALKIVDTLEHEPLR